jgi:hypothetical protein
MGSALFVSQEELGEPAGLTRQRTNAAINVRWHVCARWISHRTGRMSIAIVPMPAGQASIYGRRLAASGDPDSL